MAKEIELVVLSEYEAPGRDLVTVTVQRVTAPVSNPARIADEAEARLAFLRSRPLTQDSRLRPRERAVAEELELLAERCRSYVTAEREERLSDWEAAAEREKLDKLAFSVVGRFSALLEELPGSFATRAQAESQRRRVEELAAIERFLAAHGGAATGTDGR